MLLLDTNALSPEWVADQGSAISGPLFTSSVSAQEVLGMQKPNKEVGYRYALPVLDERIHIIRQGMPPEELVRWIVDHAKRYPVSKQADRLVVPRSKLRAECLELGHAAVAVAHEQALDKLLYAYAKRGLHGKSLKRVLGKWEFLREEVEAVIPLDEDINGMAVSLANRFVADGHKVKGTQRNTLNDMLVAATAQATGLTLVSADKQLMDFYQDLGWTITEVVSAFTATPAAQIHLGQERRTPRAESRRYINRPARIRTHIDYTRPPLPRR